MTEDIHTKLFDLLRDMQKDLSQVEMTLTAHLESSDVRIEAWEKLFIDIKKTLDSHDDKIKELLLFKQKCLSEKNAISNIRGIVQWVAGLAGVGAAIYFGMKK